MFIKYGFGTDGIVNYLKSGDSKDRNFSRNELDYRFRLHGNLSELDYVLKQKKERTNSNGANYKHFVISFEKNEVKLSDLIEIDNKFKEFIFSKSYKKDELYYFSEIHYPKIKGYMYKNGELNKRKVHIHVVIPVINLYTLNKGFNFNFNNFDFRKTLSIFVKKINSDYNLNSPFELKYRSLINYGKEYQIYKKTGVYYKNSILKYKESILKNIILDKNYNIKSVQELFDFMDRNKLIVVNTLNLTGEISLKKGDINANIIKLITKDKTLILNDFCFSNDFLSLDYEVKNNLYKKSNLNSLPNNSRLTDIEVYKLNKYYEIDSFLLKYSKIQPRLIETIKKNQLFNKEELKNIELEFYGKYKNQIIDLNSSVRKIDNDSSLSVKDFNDNIYPKKTIAEYILNSELDNINVINKALEIKFGIDISVENIVLDNFEIDYLNNFIKNNLENLKLLSKRKNIISCYYNENSVNNLILDHYNKWVKKADSVSSIINLTKNKAKYNFENSKQFFLINKRKRSEIVNVQQLYFGKSKKINKEISKINQKYINIIRSEKIKHKINTKELIQIYSHENTVVNKSFVDFISEYASRTSNITIKKEISDYIKLYNIISKENQGSFNKNNIEITIIDEDMVYEEINSKKVLEKEESLLNSIDYDFLFENFNNDADDSLEYKINNNKRINSHEFS